MDNLSRLPINHFPIHSRFLNHWMDARPSPHPWRKAPLPHIQNPDDADSQTDITDPTADADLTPTA
jgi:hypothetical protein